eukprot:205631_1
MEQDYDTIVSQLIAFGYEESEIKDAITHIKRINKINNIKINDINEIIDHIERLQATKKDIIIENLSVAERKKHLVSAFIRSIHQLLPTTGIFRIIPQLVQMECLKYYSGETFVKFGNNIDFNMIDDIITKTGSYRAPNTGYGQIYIDEHTKYVCIWTFKIISDISFYIYIGIDSSNSKYLNKGFYVCSEFDSLAYKSDGKLFLNNKEVASYGKGYKSGDTVTMIVYDGTIGFNVNGMSSITRDIPFDKQQKYTMAVSLGCSNTAVQLVDFKQKLLR